MKKRERKREREREREREKEMLDTLYSNVSTVSHARGPVVGGIKITVSHPSHGFAGYVRFCRTFCRVWVTRGLFDELLFIIIQWPAYVTRLR